MDEPSAVSSLARLRLMQIAESSFPVGGFAYSHGLEWMAHEGLVTGEGDLALVLDAYVAQAGAGQWLPAALAAWSATGGGRLRWVDQRLHLAMLVPAERDASQAMGLRLLRAAANGLDAPPVAAFRADVEAGEAPGHYPVAFGLVARAHGVESGEMLGALGMTMAFSLTQAAVRLNLIGQAAATRLVAAAAPGIEAAAHRTLNRRGAFAPGSFAPGLDLAGLLHPQLPFRMFAS